MSKIYTYFMASALPRNPKSPKAFKWGWVEPHIRDQKRGIQESIVLAEKAYDTTTKTDTITAYTLGLRVKQEAPFQYDSVNGMYLMSPAALQGVANSLAIDAEKDDAAKGENTPFALYLHAPQQIILVKHFKDPASVDQQQALRDQLHSITNTNCVNVLEHAMSVKFEFADGTRLIKSFKPVIKDKTKTAPKTMDGVNPNAPIYQTVGASGRYKHPVTGP